MPTSKRTPYKGYCITTRWAELMFTGSLSGSRRWTKVFDANFAVHHEPPDEEDWQEFPIAVFTTSNAAEENALAVAKRSVDERFVTRSSSTPSGPPGRYRM